MYSRNNYIGIGAGADADERIALAVIIEGVFQPLAIFRLNDNDSNVYHRRLGGIAAGLTVAGMIAVALSGTIGPAITLGNFVPVLGEAVVIELFKVCAILEGLIADLFDRFRQGHAFDLSVTGKRVITDRNDRFAVIFTTYDC